MGKGDKKTRRGKITNRSYGVRRPRKRKPIGSVVKSRKKTTAKPKVQAKPIAEVEVEVAVETVVDTVEVVEVEEKVETETVVETEVTKDEVVEAPKEEVKEEKPAEDAKPKTAAKKATAKPEDLKKIEGIGPKIAETLNAADIVTFTDLSKAKPAKLSEIIANVRGNHVTDTWPKQAKMAADGKWDELKAYQDKLDGGLEK